MAVRDIYDEGCVKMTVMKIPDVRFRRRCRIKREIKTLQTELDNYLGNKDGEAKMKKVTLLMKQRSIECNERIEYRMMKKSLWIIPRNITVING